MDRRDFLASLAASGTFAALCPEPASAEAASIPQTGTADQPHNSYSFWSNYYSAEGDQHFLFGHGKKSDAVSEDHQINFLRYRSDDHTLHYPQNVPDSDLPELNGDVVLSMSMGGMHLSDSDRDIFQNLQSAQLRLDLAQNQPMMNLIDKLAWASVAAIFLSRGKLPALQDLSFGSSATQSVILPGGSGRVGVNVSLKKKGSAFYNMLQRVVKDFDKFAPVCGLPAISIRALDAFNQMYGAFEDRTQFLLQTLPQTVFATQTARRVAGTSVGLNLVSGDYVLVPQKDVGGLDNKLEDYKLMQGYLVPADIKGEHSIYEVARDTAKEVTYLTISVKVEPFQPNGTSVAESSSPANESSGSSPKDSDSAKSHGTPTASIAPGHEHKPTSGRSPH